MVIINLKGGLGNIMFQYALGRHLAYTNKTDIKYDISSYKTNPLGDYSFALDEFNINVKDNLIDEMVVKKLKGFQKRIGRRWFFYNLLVSDRKKYVSTQNFNFDPNILTINASEKDIYLDGWWQTDKYFLDIRDILLKDFEVNKPIQGKNKEISERISKTNSVSIHVRRADYVNNPRTKFVHGELTTKYYSDAVSYLSSKKSNLSIFIFSDDIPWVKENLRFQHPTEFIDWNTNSPHEDIRLMSLCKDNIIANSTLGWWGAWLNKNGEKIVIGPKQWFANAPQCNTEDLLPESWIKM